ncbi:hypothetical protein [Sphingobacterium puteale]|uniref:hypothetical protein n=1 Tax=Sphingobacterium puteale TaxID=2420510 RepID=UPI003D9695B7
MIIAIIFFVGTMIETESYGKEALGEERYNVRVNDSYLYALILFGCVMLIIIPATGTGSIGLFYIGNSITYGFPCIHTRFSIPLHSF